MAENLSQSELDYPFKLLEYFNGYRISKVIFSACELGVFDLLMTSDPLSAEQIATKLNLSADGAERLLDTLVGVEILEVDTSQETALYSSTDVSNLYLAKNSPKSLHDMVLYQSQTIYPLWNNLADARPTLKVFPAVRLLKFALSVTMVTAEHSAIDTEGKNQNEKTFGLPADQIFEAVYRSEEDMLKFMGLMNSSWILDGHDIVTAFDLSPFKTIVDLGGCTGALARELSRQYPSSTVTVYDLPSVTAAAQKHFSQEDDNITFQSGDFFTDALPSADLFVLARIIHDWPEEKCLSLLRRIHSACKPGGGVLLVEALLFENRRGPVMAQLCSLNMLVQTEGRERRPSEYVAVLNRSGFQDVQVSRTGKCYDAILATT